jgi:hypothetical protein
VSFPSVQRQTQPFWSAQYMLLLMYEFVEGLWRMAKVPDHRKL